MKEKIILSVYFCFSNLIDNFCKRKPLWVLALWCCSKKLTKKGLKVSTGKFMPWLELKCIFLYFSTVFTYIISSFILTKPPNTGGDFLFRNWFTKNFQVLFRLMLKIKKIFFTENRKKKRYYAGEDSLSW